MEAPETPLNPKFTDVDPHISQEITESDDNLLQLRLQNDSLAADLESLRSSYQSVQLEAVAAEQQKDGFLERIVSLKKVLADVSGERDALRDEKHRLEASFREREKELVGSIDEEVRRREEARFELEVLRGRVWELEEEKRARDVVLSRSLDAIRTMKEGLVTVISSTNEENLGIRAEEGEEMEEMLMLDDETRPFWGELREVAQLATVAEASVGEYQEMRKKEKRELENSVVSLTEENRDINSLLRIALLEKEAVGKSLNQKRVPLLQFAERGLQKVGFGFMMGAAANEQSSDTSGVSIYSKSDGSECEEEGVSLASTVEKIMKNLRLEITQLRKSSEEARSDAERLQSLTEKQAQKIAENTLYIKELESRETLLAQNVGELLRDIKETEEEVNRWREACELEVKAGRHEIQERDKVVMVAILKQELDKTKAALHISNSKLKLKEDLAAAAMAAQAAAERSLQLADGRAAGLHGRIEELTRQLEETDSREKNSLRKVRHLCWPWRSLRLNPLSATRTRFQNIKRMLPEMQALLPHRD